MSIATTFEPELQSIMTESKAGEDSTGQQSKDSKFRERYSTSIPKTSNEVEKNTRFWKSCLKEDKVKVEEKFAETAEYLRRPNVLYPYTESSNNYHTLPSNSAHFIQNRMYPEMFSPGSYHTIAHYQLYKRPLDYCDYYHQRPNYIEHDFAKTLGRTRRESPMANKAPLKLKKLIKTKTMIMPPPPSVHPPPPPPIHPPPTHPHFHLHHMHHHHHHPEEMKMLTWSPYSSHMMYNDHHHHHPTSMPGGCPGTVAKSMAGKSLDELRF